MKSLTSKFASARGWALFLILFLGAGLFVAACGDEDVPTPTTPAPTPPAPPPAPAPEPEPEPTPEPPAVPVGLRISASEVDFIEWSWSAVEGVSGYDVQYSANEAFTDADEEIARTAEQISYRRENLEAETNHYLRVRSAAGTGDGRVTSGWSTHVTGMTPAATPPPPVAPATPANLRVSETGEDFIEWTWDPVAGAAGYIAQFSTDSGFGAGDPQFTVEGAAKTKHTVPNLDAASDGYLRVRAYVGTATEPTLGEWTEGARGTTEEPTAPVTTALSAPTGLRTGSSTTTTITLDWDEVDDADSYDVEQRPADGSWTGASCDGGDSQVNNEECEASGLTRGSDYSFRVRANPDPDDDTLEQSAWSSTASARTSGSTPSTPITSGDDDLNVQWTSESGSITWNWDPVADRNDRKQIDHWAFVTASEECGTVETPSSTEATLTLDTWVDLGMEISDTFSIPQSEDQEGQVRTLCLVRTWEEDLGNGLKARRFGTPAVVMAATPPKSLIAAGNPELNENATEREPVHIEWTWEVDPGFRYPGMVLSVTRDDSLPAADSSGSCSDGKDVTSPTMSGRPNVDVRHREELGAADAYKKYRFCARAENDHGASDWMIIGTDAVETIPGKPGKVSYDSRDSEFDSDPTGSHILLAVAWSVKENPQTPSRADGSSEKNYDVVVVRSSKSSAKTDVCETDSSTADYEPVVGANIDDTLGGTQVTIEGTPGADLLGNVGIGTYYLYACVRANPDPERSASGGSDAADMGPWEVGRSTAFKRALGTSRLSAANVTGSTTETKLTWTAVNGADTYTVHSVSKGAADTAFVDATPVSDCRDVANTAERTCTVTRSSGSDADYYWVAATAAVSGSSLTKESNRVEVRSQ